MLDHHRTGRGSHAAAAERPSRCACSAVHLKSACHSRPLTDTALTARDKPDATPACLILGAQVKPLEDWIDARAREGVDFVVLGDFNRRLGFGPRADDPARDPRGRQLTLWKELDDGDPPAPRLARLTAGRRAGPQLPARRPRRSRRRNARCSSTISSSAPTLAGRVVPGDAAPVAAQRGANHP